MNPKTTICILLGCLFILSAPGPVQAQAPDTAPSIAGGQGLWAENCAPCHGPTGLGDGPTAQAIDNSLPNFADPASARQMVPLDAFDVIKNGRIENLMPPWGNQLSDDQMWDLTAFVWSLGVPPGEIEAGQAVYAQNCAACHGERGTGDRPEAPANIVDFSDAGQMVEVSQANLLDNFNGAGPHAGLDLTEAEIWPALDYIRTFTFELPQRDGVLSGQVINRTTNEPAAGVDLTLRIFSGDAEVERITAQADERGRYTFSELPADPNLIYRLEGVYQDITYDTEPTPGFAGGDTEATLDLAVYEPTTDSAALEVTQLHYVVAASPESLNVLQIFVVGNAVNQTYVGDENGHTFSFFLPENARNPIFQADPLGSRFIETGPGFADTRPVLPGEEGLTIAVTYDIPYNSDTLAVEMPLPADVRSASLLLGNQDVTLSSSQLEFIGDRDIQGQPFALFGGANLAQGEVLTFELSNLRAAAGALALETTIATNLVDQSLVRLIVLALGGAVILGVAVVYPLVRDRQTAGDVAADPALYRQKLLLTLARLDEAFEAGELDEAIYREARARYKARLAVIVNDPNSETG